jgi:hypothetical protein
LDLGDLYILTKKQASPSAKPDNQLGSGIPLKLTLGLEQGIVLGKDSFNLLDKPTFNEAFKFTISCNPLVVRCFLALIILITFTNISKSARFCINNKYFSK